MLMITVKCSVLRFFTVLAIITLSLLRPPAGFSQSVASDVNVDNGTHWYGSYDGVHENISLSSGNLSFCIPLVSLRGHNNHNLTLPLCYNSQFQEVTTPGGSQSPFVGDVLSFFPWIWAPNTPSGSTTPAMGPGWAFTGAPMLYASPSTGTPIYFFPDGAKYSFPSFGSVGPDGQGADIWESGNGYFVQMKDGTVFNQISGGGSACAIGVAGCSKETFTDGSAIYWNNNWVTGTGTSNSIIDTVGRTVTVQTGSAFSGSTTASTAYINLQYPDSNGNTQTVQVKMSTMQFSCNNLPGSVVPNEVGSGPITNSETAPLYSMPTEIILPDGLTYSFQYDSCGMLRKVTYPSGGYTRYDYTAEQSGLVYDSGGTISGFSNFLYYTNQVTEKHVCSAASGALNAAAASGGYGNTCAVQEATTTYTPTVYLATTGGSMSVNANTQNTVVDPVGNQTVYQFSLGNTMPFSGIQTVETSRVMTDASGNFLKSVTTQYASTTMPGSILHSGLASSVWTEFGGTPPTLPTIQTTKLNNGQVSQIQWSYDLWNLTEGDSPLIEERVYDYGQGAPGALLKRTDYTWLHRDNPTYYGWFVNTNPNGGSAHICDRKTSETVYDGNGNQIAKTTYVYDYGNPATKGTRGLMTSESHWRNTDGAMLTTSYVYDGYGNVTQKTDPVGNITSYSYKDNFAGGYSPNPGTYAFLTSTTDMLNHITQTQYYWGSGLVAASCGVNFTGSKCSVGLTSAADYGSYTYDGMGRRTSSTSGDGGQTINCFSELGGSGCAANGSYPLQVTSTTTIAAGIGKSSTATIDGEGRTVRSQLNSDPNCPGGTVNVDTVYDLDGRKSTVSNPYCSTNTSAATTGLTTYNYDGLSRVVSVVHPDGTSASNTYSGRAVLSADEGNGTNRIQRISQSDALGRLHYVCEVTGQTQQGNANNSPSACNLDVSGSGFLTTYGYDGSGSNGPLESLTSVSQGGVGRSFIYDSLGELRSATNPESGTTTYQYDNAGNLHSKTDANGLTTTYSYDIVYRLTGKSYSDNVTPSACFQYDQSNTANGSGRLATEWTQMGACSSAPPSSGVLTQRTFAAYDLMGRVVTDEQCATVGNCTASTPWTLNYGYDLAGDLTSFGNGLTGSQALSYAAQYNSAGRLAALSGSQTPGSAPATLFTATGYTPAGALSDALIGFGSTPNLSFHRDYNNRLLPIDEVDTAAKTPGTATVQITGSEQKDTNIWYSMGSLTINGAELSGDSGDILLQVNGAPIAGAAYGQYDTPQTIAGNLAAQLTCGNGALVQGHAVGATLYLISCTMASNNNYSYSAGVNGCSLCQSPQHLISFSVTNAGSNLTPVTSTTSLPSMPAYNNPSATSVTFSGTGQSGQTGAYEFLIFPGSVNSAAPVVDIGLNWGSTSSTASLAAALAASFTPCSSSNTTVTASLSGSTVTIASCNTSTTYSIQSLLVANSGGSSPSFLAMTNGSYPSSSSLSIPGSPVDTGTVTLTVNGTQIASATYGPNDTPSTIAGNLAAAASSSVVTVSSNGANLTMNALGDGSITDYSYALNVVSNSPALFPTPSFSSSAPSGDLTGGTNVPLYNWAITSYAPNGDVLAMNDAVMGSWTYQYDDFNRLTNGAAASGFAAGLNLSWTYDRYGNRWAQNATGSGGAGAVQPQLSFTGNNNRVDGWNYDQNNGNLLNDGRNSYTYDAENRIATLNGQPTYVYDAEGRRVAKLGSGGAVTASYILGLGGEQVTELDGSGNWKHSNAYAGGRMVATYEGPAGQAALGYHFHLTDWLGTNRMQVSPGGGQDETCTSYPFGDGLNCTGPDATEHHYTGKERDPESGLDYFFARYVNSNIGRFMTPDWAGAPTAVPYATFGDPQTLNLYGYVNNNPNTGIDVDGHVSLQMPGPISSEMNPNQGNWVAAATPYDPPPDPSGGQASGSGAGTSTPLPTPPGARQQQKSCGFFCRLFHTDHVPYRLVIKPGETENGISNSNFHYELQNKEGQKLTGKYGLKEHLWDDPGAQLHHVGGHNSEDVFVPQNSQGEWVDTVGYASLQGGLRGGSYDVYQTFSVSYKGTSTDLGTEFEHTTSVMGLNVFANVIDIKP
jgi:RHS repeat-associated protein